VLFLQLGHDDARSDPPADMRLAGFGSKPMLNGAADHSADHRSAASERESRQSIDHSETVAFC
jgi:hypothetical protein